jgi:hypothetical protein
VCEFISLLVSLVHRCVGSPDCGGVLVYICVSDPYGLCTAHRGPCIANYIPTLLGLEEYTGNYFPNNLQKKCKFEKFTQHNKTGLPKQFIQIIIISPS